MTPPVHVENAEDPRLADYRAVRERDLVGRRGRFVLEGEVVVRAAVRAGRVELESLLLAEKRVAALSDVIDALRPGTHVYVASQTLMDAVVGFPIHRGVLALGIRPAPREAEAALDALRSEAIVLSLCGIANHDNMGGLFRNAAAFGVDLVLVDSDCCDPLYRKAIRVSVGAVVTTPFVRLAGGMQAVDLLRRHGFDVWALSPGGSTPLHELRRPRRAALMLGPEGPGLDRDVLAATSTVSIAMAAGFDSLNVAVAAGIALHHLTVADAC